MIRKEKKIGLRLTDYQLEKTIVAILNNPDNRRFCQNVKDLLDGVDPDSYSNDANRASDVFLIKQIVNLVLSSNVVSKDIIYNTIDLTGRYNETASASLAKLFNDVISDGELKALDNKISEELKYMLVALKADEVMEKISNIKSGNYDDLKPELSALGDDIASLDHDFKRARETVDESKNIIDFSDMSLGTRLSNIAKKINDPSQNIKTGIQLLNQILDGGWHPQRLYIAEGLAKQGKSKFLLESVIWARKYNVLAAKDPTKKPIILYLTLENTPDETALRMLNYAKGNDWDMAQHTPEENRQSLIDSGITKMPETEDDPLPDTKPDIVVMYKPNKSITVDDIRVILDDFRKQGKEVVFLVVDYLKRLRAINPDRQGNIRLDLGEITNDLHSLAIDENIPVLTAMQLNREALANLDSAASFVDKITAVSKIGGSNTGESIDIIQNADFTFAINTITNQSINPETGHVEYNDTYMTFNVIGSRMKQATPKTTFAQQYETNNTMKLEEDVYGPSKSVDLEYLKELNRKNSAVAPSVRRAGGPTF